MVIFEDGRRAVPLDLSKDVARRTYAMMRKAAPADDPNAADLGVRRKVARAPDLLIVDGGRT